MSQATREKGSSITRVLEILETVARSERPMSATDIAFELDIPKASAHRLVQTLEAEGFIQTNMRGNLIAAKRLNDMAFGILESANLKAQRRAILEKLTHEIDETCGISIPDGIEMIYYDRVQANWPLQVYLPIGSRVPISCTSGGKLYLSQMPPAKLKRLVDNIPLSKRARNTIIDKNQFLKEIALIRETNIGIDNEEFIDGMVACSVPINVNGKFHAALFCHAPVIRKTMDDLLLYAPKLFETANKITEFLEEQETTSIE
jgi:DNA-binding IclR family transcriptional regulator